MSWGYGYSYGSNGESSLQAETSDDSYFTTPSGHTGVTFVASTGDAGYSGCYPAYSPNVVAVGGTTLSINTSSPYNWAGETGWSYQYYASSGVWAGGGGGQSLYESEPSYQDAVQTSTMRQIPDVAFDADPNSGVYVYDSYGYSGLVAGVGGTSLAAPCFAGLIAVANQLRTDAGLATLDPYGNPTQTQTLLYQLAGSSSDYNPSGDYHDITSGNNGYSAAAGYDMVTGLGSPVANLLVPALVGNTPDLTVTNTHSGAFHPSDVGDTYTITVTNSGGGPTSGTVNLTDALPAGLTATAFTGNGWTTTLSPLTATRSDALATGTDYPALTLTVNIGSSVSGTVTNTVTVSGGGETNTSNDTATDSAFVGLPGVTGTSPSLNGGTLPVNTTTLAVNFNTTVLGAGTSANYQLQSVGPDGLLGTADDVYYTVTPSYSGTTATLTFPALPENVYRLTVDDTITDASGVRLDGNGDGVPGGNWSTDFVVVGNGIGNLLGTAATYAVGASPLSVAVGRLQRRRQTRPGRGRLRRQHRGHSVEQRQRHLLQQRDDLRGRRPALRRGGGPVQRQRLPRPGRRQTTATTPSRSSRATATALLTCTTPSTPAPQPIALATGDFNGDGKLDLAVANYGGGSGYGNGSVEVFLGNDNFFERHRHRLFFAA